MYGGPPILSSHNHTAAAWRCIRWTDTIFLSLSFPFLSSPFHLQPSSTIISFHLPFIRQPPVLSFHLHCLHHHHHPLPSIFTISSTIISFHLHLQHDFLSIFTIVNITSFMPSPFQLSSSSTIIIIISSSPSFPFFFIVIFTAMTIITIITIIISSSFPLCHLHFIYRHLHRHHRHQGVLYCAWGGVGFALGWLYMAHGPPGGGGGAPTSVSGAYTQIMTLALG